MGCRPDGRCHFPCPTLIFVPLKKLTIAIPTLNAAKTLGSTLESLRCLEGIANIVLVDSFSSDQTLEIAKSHAVEVRQCQPGNMYAAINLGLKNAKTPWVTYINADDLIYAATLRKRLMSLPRDVEISYGTVDFVDEDGRFLRSWRPASARGALKLYRAGYSPMLQQGTLIRTELYEALGGFNEKFKYVADSDLWYRALELGATVCRDPKISVAAFRLHQEQITQRLKGDMRSEHEQMLQQHGNVLKTQEVLAEFLHWRVENVGSYLERWMRAFRMGLRPFICSSYELH